MLASVELDAPQSALGYAGAIAEARRRWGERGAISLANEYRNARCLVGELMPGPHFVIRGRGATWEAAFADAEARVLNASRRRAEH